MLVFLNHLLMVLFYFTDNAFSVLRIVKNGNVKLNIFPNLVPQKKTKKKTNKESNCVLMRSQN